MTVESPPEVLPAADWRFPAVRESLLRNGIRLLAYHCPGQYVVSTSLVFDLPLNAEPTRARGGRRAGRPSAWCGRPGGLSADDFSDALAACGAELEASASPDGFSVQLSVPVSQLARGLDLMAMAVAEPSYAAKEFEQEKRLRLQEIEHAKAYPGSVTIECMNAALFGDARAARPVGGSTESVEAVSRDDLAAFAATYLHPGIATLVMAGDFSAVDPLELAERVARSVESRARAGGRARGQPGERPTAPAARRLAGCTAGHRAAGRTGDHPRRPALAGVVRRQLRGRRQLRLAAQHGPARAEGSDVRRQLGSRQRPEGRAARDRRQRAERGDAPRRSVRCSRSCGTPPAP